MSYHLKLVKGRSYTSFDGAISATRKNPDIFVDDEATARAAEQSGYFAIIGEGEASLPPDNLNSEGDSKDEAPVRNVSELNVSELSTLAAYHDIDIKGVTKKADIIAKIKASLDEETWNGGCVAYGSPTMTEIQE